MIEVVQALVEAGANLNQAKSGATPLLVASYNDHMDVMRYLAEAGVISIRVTTRVAPLLP